MDRNWKIPGKSLDESNLRRVGEQVAAQYEGVSVQVDKEDSDFVTFFFSVPWEEGVEAGHATVEITVYALGKDGLVLSLEADAADNTAAQDDADQLAEDLVGELQGEPLDLWVHGRFLRTEIPHNHVRIGPATPRKLGS